MRKKALGEKHPSMLASMGNLASVYQEQGRWKEAEELWVQVLEIKKKDNRRRASFYAKEYG